MTGHAEQFVRARVMSQIKLASLVMVTADPCEAAFIGGQVLDSVSAVDPDAADDRRDVRRFGEPHEQLTEVAELLYRIGSAVVAW